MTSTGRPPGAMYSLTEHNPKVCLTADDIEGVYLYPLCDGRALPSSNGLKKGEAGYEREGLECYKTKLYIGAVRVLVYIFVPILIILIIQILILHRLKQHHELVDELHESRTKAVQAANRHKKMSIERRPRPRRPRTRSRGRGVRGARVEERAGDGRTDDPGQDARQHGARPPRPTSAWRRRPRWPLRAGSRPKRRSRLAWPARRPEAPWLAKLRNEPALEPSVRAASGSVG